MRIGVLTGGGDCPGLNPAIRAVVYRAGARGPRRHRILGRLEAASATTSRGPSSPATSPRRSSAGERCSAVPGPTRSRNRRTPRRCSPRSTAKVDALVVIGGDDTLSAGASSRSAAARSSGVPKTMDNDVAATDWTFGFDSAATVAVDALERLRDTAGSHHRPMVLEVMGRHAGWVALATGLGGGADFTLLPEEPFDEARVPPPRPCGGRARRGTPSSSSPRGWTSDPARGAAGAKRRVRSRAAEGARSRSGGRPAHRSGHGDREPERRHRPHPARRFPDAVRPNPRHAARGEGGRPARRRSVRRSRRPPRRPRSIGVPFDEALRETKKVGADWADLLHTFDA